MSGYLLLSGFRVSFLMIINGKVKWFLASLNEILNITLFSIKMKIFHKSLYFVLYSLFQRLLRYRKASNHED